MAHERIRAPAGALHGIGALTASAIGYMLGSGMASSIYEIMFQHLPTGLGFEGFKGGKTGGGGAGLHGRWTD